MPQQITVDPSEVQPLVVDPSQVQSITVDPSEVGGGEGRIENVPLPKDALAKFEQAPGVPIFTRAPAAQALPKEPVPQIPWLPSQMLSGLGTAAEAESHVAKNVFGLLDTAADKISALTGLPKGDLFKHISDWAGQQQEMHQRVAERFTQGEQGLPSKIVRAVTGGVASIPAYGIATGLGGPAGGMAMMGALETADQGWKHQLIAAGHGALLGKAMHVLGPFARYLRSPATALMTYADQTLNGADHETALSNAVAMGGLSLLGRPGTRATGAAEKLTPTPSLEQQRIIDLAKEHKVRISAGDIAQVPWLKNLEVSAEELPGVGMQSFRAKQSAEAKTAAQGLKGQFREGFLDTDPSSIEALTEAAQAGDERARKVLAQMQEAGNDPDRVIQASIGLGDWTTRQTAKGLYDTVQELAEKHNLGDVPLDDTTKSINSALKELRPAKLPNNEVINLLGKIKQSISPQEGETGKQIKPNNSYGLIRQLHSDLGERIRDYYQGNNALIGEKGVGFLERVQNALEDDMRSYAAQSGVPEIVEAGKTADEYYRTARVPFKGGMITSAATSTEPDQIWQQFIKEGKGDRAQNFFNALDEKGRAAIRYNMVRKAVDDSINPQSGVFSPQKFFTNLNKLEEPYGVFFKGMDRAQVQGFGNLMQHITRAGQFAENPPTGKRAIPFVLGAAAASTFTRTPQLIVPAAGLLALARGLFTTNTGRSFLLGAARIKPGTPLMESLWRNIAAEMPNKLPPESPPPGASQGRTTATKGLSERETPKKRKP